MATTIKVLRPTNFAELLEAVELFQAGSKTSWYRGCRDKDYDLKPTLFRHKAIKKRVDIADLEDKLTTRFVQRSLPFLDRSLTDEWDKLFLMQHYGVPTRLLDWSENPFVSIYFALIESGARRNADAAFWMCNPIEWNRAALKYLSFQGEILDQTSTLLRAYTPGTAVAEIPDMPIMMYGSYNSARIVAQRGGFALFGKGMDPMEKIYKLSDFADDILVKVEIGNDHIEELRESLFRKGFTESVVFPDLDGLSKELKRTFGF